MINVVSDSAIICNCDDMETYVG